jgi:hypothetical protein
LRVSTTRRNGMNKVQDTGWRVIGDVSVDSALIALVDPMNELDLDDHLGGDELVQTVRSAEGYLVGLVIRPGVGDGTYQVEARLEDIEGLGWRIAEIRIRFL